jgi:hypothetical protein
MNGTGRRIAEFKIGAEGLLPNQDAGSRSVALISIPAILGAAADTAT